MPSGAGPGGDSCGAGCESASVEPLLAWAPPFDPGFAREGDAAPSPAPHPASATRMTQPSMAPREATARSWPAWSACAQHGGRFKVSEQGINSPSAPSSRETEAAFHRARSSATCGDDPPPGRLTLSRPPARSPAIFRTAVAIQSNAFFRRSPPRSDRPHHRPGGRAAGSDRLDCIDVRGWARGGNRARLFSGTAELFVTGRFLCA